MTRPEDARPDAMTAPDSPSWEDTPAFREIFLAHFPPEAAESLRQTGRHLYDAVLEVDLYELDEPWVQARVRALAEDLRFTARVFQTLTRAPAEAGLTDSERQLAERCLSWAAEVTAIVLAIEGALDPEVEP